jgi:glycosyltransferase involved in cell wall biosynthesis
MAKFASQMIDDPLVSVVTPCHNAEAFIGETIESVAAQSHQPVEHVIVDDGSSDGSWAVIQRYACVRAERLPVSRGASHARNRGAALATGEFLMFLDADDLLAPDALAALVAALRDRPEAIAHVPWRRLIGDRERPPEVGRPSPDTDAALREWLAGRAWVPPCAVLWPRGVFERSGRWDEELTVDDDGELMRRVLARGVPLVAAEGGAALYRTHGAGRVSLSQNAAHLRSSSKSAIDRLAADLEHQGRLAEFASAVGTAYQRVALAAFQEGQHDLGEECQVLAARLGGRADVSRTVLGRALVRMLGLERKERVVQWLARRRIASPGRRTSMRRRERSQAP